MIDQIANTKSRTQQGYVSVSSYPVNPRLVSLLPEPFARAHGVVPLVRQGEAVVVAMANPNDSEVLAELRRLMAREIQPVLSTPTEIEVALNRALAPQKMPSLWSAVRRVSLETGLLTPHEVSAMELDQLTSPCEPTLERELKVLGEEEYTEALCLALGLPRLRLNLYRITPAFARIIPRPVANRWKSVALFPIGRELVVASHSLLPISVIDSIRSSSGLEPRLALCTLSEIERALESCYGVERADASRAAEARKPLWEQLIDDGLVRKEHLEGAKTVAAQTGESIEDVLLRLGQLSEHEIQGARARLHGTQLVSLRKQYVDQSLALSIPEPIARRYRCIPLQRLRGSVTVAMANLGDKDAVQVLEILLGQPVQAVACSDADLEDALSVIYSIPSEPQQPQATQLGQYFVRSGWLTAEQINAGLELQQRNGQRLGRCLIELSLLDEAGLAEMLGLQLRLPWVTLLGYSVPAETLSLIPVTLARGRGVVPLYRDGQLLTVATADPLNSAALQAVRQHAGMSVRVTLAGETSIRTAIDRMYDVDPSKVSNELREFGNRLVQNGLLTRDQLLQVWQRYLKAEVPFDAAITGLGFLTEERLAGALAEYLGVPQSDLSFRREPVTVVDGLGVKREILKWVEPLDCVVSRLLPEEVARRCSAVPVKRVGDTVFVSFVNPLEESAWRPVQDALGQPVAIMVGTRTQIAEAIRRVYRRQALGDILIEADLINRHQLEKGLALHRKTGVQLGKALISLGYITQDQLAACLSDQQGLDYCSLSDREIPIDLVRAVPEEVARRRRVIPVGRENGFIIVAMANPLDAAAVDEVQRYLDCPVKPVYTTEQDVEDALERIYREDYLVRSTSDLVVRYPDESAISVLNTAQKIFVLALLAISALLVAINPVGYITALTALSTLFYVSFSGYKFYLIYKALSHSLEVNVTPEEIAALDDRELPVYTVLIPLYKEAKVIPTLVSAVAELDYPKTKLDVKLLLEEDDEETIAAVRRHQLPPHFKLVVVPNSKPKGKPKACNYGLIHAEGEYIVIYDAEDVPERDQLKKALVAFRKVPQNIGCIQAKLNYYNRDQNLLTRWFTTEYSMWFDLFMPALDASNAPVPLGGTSNHFRTNLLREIGAWDPYNVTEDADLGVRLFKAGWKTAIIDSTTYEEANSELYNWIRQRSRWVKGYMQTYLVHMRHPIRLLREIGPYQFFSFNMVVGGTFFGFLMNPIYWLLTAAWFLTHSGVIQQLFPGPIFYIGAMGLYFGNFAFTYANIAGCMRRQYYDMVKYALLSPVYWSLMSIGAWKGFLQLLYDPSYWEKTVHGLYRGELDLGPGVDSVPENL